MCFAIQIFQVPGLSPRQWFLATNFLYVKSIQYSPTQTWHPITVRLMVTWCTNKFNIQELYALPTLYLCIYLRTNSDLYHLHHKLNGFYNRTEKRLRTGSLNSAVCASSLNGWTLRNHHPVHHHSNRVTSAHMAHSCTPWKYKSGVVDADVPSFIEHWCL
jgi:hypothetical protein